MRNSLKSLFATAAILAVSAGASEAADLEVQRIIEDPTYAATISGGFIHTWSELSGDDEEWDWNSPFGEAAVLWRPTGLLNIQSDFAFHSHRLDLGSGKDENIAIDQWHTGGVIFLRDPTMGLFGIDGAVGGIDASFVGAVDVFRIGGRAEWFAGDMATIGGGVGYHNLDFSDGKPEVDGINFNAFVNFYVNEDLALKAKFDYAEFDISGEDFSYDMWSIGGEAEYLLRGMFGGNSSVFVGGRYAETDLDEDVIEDTQIFVGFRSYFVTGGSLANHHRTNTLDNTNTLLEKVPFIAAFD